MDLVGDFLLSGYRVLGKVKCYQGGHELTNMFLRKMLGSKMIQASNKLDKYTIIENLNLEPTTKIAVNA